MNKGRSYIYLKMYLVPITRIKMRNLNNEIDCKITNDAIMKIIQYIYTNAIKTAKTTYETSYNYKVPYLTDKVANEFHITNMCEILRILKELFPKCSVRHTLVSLGKDGKLYDISKINDDILSCINEVNKNSYIIIDWS